jgi:hypothetical protein
LGVNTANSRAVLYLGAKRGKYIYDQKEVNAENLASLLERVKAGEVDQFFKSSQVRLLPKLNPDIS